MKEQPDNKWLEILLEEEEPYRDNNGFSRKVVRALPKHRRLTWRLQRRLIKAVSVLAGLLLSLILLRGFDFPFDWLPPLPPLVWLTLSAVGVFGLLASACMWIVSDQA